MSPLIGLRRVSQSFNTLIRHRRHFAAQSRIGRRVLFFAERIKNRVVEEHYFYSAEIQKSGAQALPLSSPQSLSKASGTISSPATACSTFAAWTINYTSIVPIPESSLRFPMILLLRSLFPVNLFAKRVTTLGLIRCPTSTRSSLFKPWTSQNRISGFSRWAADRGTEEVFANGAIHWMVHDYDSYNIGDPEIYIFSFDMVEEQFRMIPHPDVSFPGKLTELGGRLALIDDFRWRVDVEYDKLHLWILEVCNNHKWVKETIHLPYAWMIHNEILAFNHDTGEMLLQPAKQLLPAKRRVGNLTIMPKRERLLYYNTKTGIFRWTELSGFPHWCRQGKILEKEMEECYFFAVDCAFTDEREKETSFK
ncbi:hypothetical protein FH972_008760 [Carpinus fangiana]|uniref:F-box associated beta-propeller type 3 domain-containing protein n=1 Tax=Carpinus fangiana TaxID=176857 RepID=A0A5N6QZN0_9ROSI|nr:hypothetical protein FH972_008760 [Carpinus fangiana]